MRAPPDDAIQEEVQSIETLGEAYPGLSCQRRVAMASVAADNVTKPMRELGLSGVIRKASSGAAIELREDEPPLRTRTVRKC